MWVPGESVPTEADGPSFSVNFDLIIKNIKVESCDLQVSTVSSTSSYSPSLSPPPSSSFPPPPSQELNVLAGEGSAAVVKSPAGAKLQPVDPIPLTLFRNGLVLFQGPFRPFTDPSTQQCVADLMEGYFPSELQSRYPEGIPLQVGKGNATLANALKLLLSLVRSVTDERCPSRCVTMGPCFQGPVQPLGGTGVPPSSSDPRSEGERGT